MIKFQASSISRVLACPGSLHLEAHTPESLRYKPFKDAATFGTICHDTAERRLKNFVKKEKNKGLVSDLKTAGITPDDMGRAKCAVNEYEKYFKKILRGHKKFRGKTEIIIIEEKFRYHGEDFECVAKADAAIITTSAAGVHADFFDLKTGNFDYSESAKNQIFFGAIVYLANREDLAGRPLRLHSHTVQPNYWRAGYSAVKHTHATGRDAGKIVRDYFTRLSHISRARDNYTPGEHCKFCPGVLLCPAMQDRAKLISLFLSSGAPAENMSTRALENLYLIKSETEIFFKAVESVLFDRMESGAEFEKLTVALTSGHRRWIDKAEVEKRLAFLGDELYEPRKIKSPAKIEKLAGRENITDLFLTPQIKKLVERVNPFEEVK